MLKAERSGYERPVKLVNDKGDTVAIIYTDKEGGDQYDTANLFVAAEDLLAALQNLVARGLINDQDGEHYEEVVAAIAKARPYGAPVLAPAIAD